MNLSDLRRLLEELKVLPSKALGQNFLHDTNAARFVAAALAPMKGQPVVEIGPGLGALTRHLLDLGAQVICIEKDYRLAGWLRRAFNGKDFLLTVGDATETDLRPLLLYGRPLVIGNLPYSVSSPLLLRWTGALLDPPLLVFTLQRELAERVCAQPGNSNFGALTVTIQSRYVARILRHLPAQLFYPKPSVESSIILLRRRHAEELPPFPPKRLRALVATAFQARRKMVGKSLRPLFENDFGECLAALQWAGIAPDTRPEDISVASWIKLSLFGETRSEAQDIEREIFDIVDEFDVVIGQATRQETHANHLRHRAVHIFIFNRAGELWLQRRSHLKDRHPGVWDSSASGHLDAGESYANAAVREVVEETGLKGTPPPLEELASLKACEETGWEFVRVYKGICEGPFDPPPTEVSHGEFFDFELIKRWIKARPEDFAPGFLKCFDALPRSVINQ